MQDGRVPNSKISDIVTYNPSHMVSTAAGRRQKVEQKLEEFRKG